MNHYAEIYRQELLNEVIPFWERNAIDETHGGYFTCLDQNGKVYDTDKFIWLQARQAWMFSVLFSEIEQKIAWRAIAKNGIDFLEKHGRDEHGNWYFSLNRQGQPLVQPYNIFSDCFAAMAFGAYYRLEPDDRYARIAIDTFENILRRKDDPKGQYNKLYPGTRELQNFALPMILCNLSLELEHLLKNDQVETLTNDIADLILNSFYEEKSGLVYENVGIDGGLVDSFEGRLLNPGHAIEAMWFLMDLGHRNNDTHLIDKAGQIMFQQLEQGWDDRYGGIFYFLDAKGHPPQQLEWDQKLWWVHLETLVALAKTYALTQSPKAKNWFEKVHEYTWSHFRDTKNGGEWYGYLNRQGEVFMKLKGGKWKGCFHVPRALLQIWKTLEK
ncbi:AGE family epimerase/isomerase [Allomuricauda sp. SCSIO 65647]|uniref:AGE family epimerase/isomerase n=1 Tax=Allomuricauda sp. SCSIO 65647 TaxID=2908843 RepID=UPI001F1723B5|nr:AGE family epimerase/isomerase [Muricauda sp. SCSIO 65647]UJH68793.1 AGE family epimerase/isomerase [Muricauda sp. SCSIO 65647]